MQPRIAIYIGGATNGLWSANSSEHRYPQAIGLALANAGYKVTCYGSGSGAWDAPAWGRMPPLPNVNLISTFEAMKQEFDICIGLPWEHGRVLNHVWTEKCATYPIKAKMYAHLTFGWHQSMVDNFACWDKNHILVYPRANLKSLAPEGQPFQYKFLPIPIGEEYLSIDVANKTDITWTSKDVFHPEWWPDRMTVPTIGLATLKALARMSIKYPQLHVNFMGTRYFDPKVSAVADKLGVMDIVNSISNKTLHGFLPHDELTKMFGRSRITTPISGMWSSFGEALCSGSVSLAYGDKNREPHTSEFDYFKIAAKHGLTLDQRLATEQEIFDVMETIYKDDNLYLELIEGYRACYVDHLYPNVVKHFEDGVLSLL